MDNEELTKRRFLDLARKAANAPYFVFTDFLGLMEQALLSTVKGELPNVKYTLFGGTDGATLCQNPDTGAYAVMRTWPLAAHDDDTFAAAVEGLMNTAERWREVLDGIREAEEAAEMAELEDDGQDEGDVPGEISLGGFMQV